MALFEYQSPPWRKLHHQLTAPIIDRNLVSGQHMVPAYEPFPFDDDRRDAIPPIRHAAHVLRRSGSPHGSRRLTLLSNDIASA